MSFFRKNRNNENYKERQFSEKKTTRFQVSDKSFQSANLVSSLAITVFVIILFLIKKNFSVSESDIQTISGITAGLCCFALAIPLFLKDFDITSNFWKQFYLIAITFLVTTFLGVISFLLIDELQSINITLYLWFFISIIISVNVVNINLLWNKTKFKISLNPVLNFSISFLVLFLSLLFSKGEFWIYATILFAIYGFYLILTLMLAILVELFFINKKMENNDTRIKKGIQCLVEKHRENALDEQTLLDKLKAEIFPNEQEIISRTKIQDLVAEMDSETDENEPKITIYRNKLIPRWKKEYDEKLEITDRTIFIHLYSSTESEKDSDKIYEYLSKNTGLSKELLIENNCISKYCLLSGKMTRPDFYNGHILIYSPVRLYDIFKKGSIFLLDNPNYSFEFLNEYGYDKVDIYKLNTVEIIWKKRFSG